MSRSRQRRDDEKEQRREAIIDAAEAVFASEGFEAAKMESVARHARISRALVYLYFKNKNELHFAICLRALRTLRERMQQAAAQHERGIDQIRAIGQAYIAFAEQSPTHFTALSRFEAHHSAEIGEGSIEQAALAAGTAVHELTIAALQRGVGDGSVRADLRDPMLIAVTLWGFSHGILQIAQTKGSFLEDAGVPVSAFLSHGIEMALQGLKPADAAMRKSKR